MVPSVGMFTAAFAIASLERALKTGCQALLALVGASASGLLGFDWGTSLSVAGMAALASILTSVVSFGIGAPGPSLIGEELVPESAGAGFDDDGA